jgi:hypothetical protein
MSRRTILLDPSWFDSRDYRKGEYSGVAPPEKDPTTRTQTVRFSDRDRERIEFIRQSRGISTTNETIRVAVRVVEAMLRAMQDKESED